MDLAESRSAVAAQFAEEEVLEVERRVECRAALGAGGPMSRSTRGATRSISASISWRAQRRQRCRVSRRRSPTLQHAAREQAAQRRRLVLAAAAATAASWSAPVGSRNSTVALRLARAGQRRGRARAGAPGPCPRRGLTGTSAMAKLDATRSPQSGHGQATLPRTSGPKVASRSFSSRYWRSRDEQPAHDPGVDRR